MPLSEHEQRLLDEMERNLYGREADVVSTGTGGLRPNYRAITLGVVLAIIGVGVMVGAVMSQMIILGVVGFVITFVGALIASRPARQPEQPASSPKAARPARSSFMDRMQQKWDERQEGHSS